MAGRASRITRALKPTLDRPNANTDPKRWNRNANSNVGFPLLYHLGMSGSYSLTESYRRVRRISRKSGSNFYRSFWLLPRKKRNAMCALYAFSRVTDDMGDSDRPVEQRTKRLKWWRTAVELNLASPSPDQPIHFGPLANEPVPAEILRYANEILPAMRDTASQYQMPIRYLLEIIDGVLADQQKTRFDTFEQLEHYCYLVASSVGLACLHIWEYEGELPVQSAIDCGLAFQLTNILRDISEDAKRGRIYLPRQHYAAHGLCEDDLLVPRADDRLSHLIGDEIRRAEELYHSGWHVWNSLGDDGKPMFSMMWRTYRRLLNRIAEAPRAVANGRVTLSHRERIGLVSQHFFTPLFRRLEVPPREITMQTFQTS